MGKVISSKKSRLSVFTRDSSNQIKNGGIAKQSGIAKKVTSNQNMKFININQPLRRKAASLAEQKIAVLAQESYNKSQNGHWFDNSLPILQDIHDKNKSLLIEEEGNIEKITVSHFGELDNIIKAKNWKLTAKDIEGLITGIKQGMVNNMRYLLKLHEADKQEYQAFYDNLLTAKNTVDRGFSVFAKKDIDQFDTIGFYHGAYYGNEEEIKRDIEEFGKDISQYLFETSENSAIGGYQRGNILALVNSAQLEKSDKSIENNLFIIRGGNNLILFVASRDIKADEEIFISYGNQF